MAEMKRGANVALTREIPGLTGLVLGVQLERRRRTRARRQPGVGDDPVRRATDGPRRPATSCSSTSSLTGAVGPAARHGAGRRQPSRSRSTCRRCRPRSSASSSCSTSTTGPAQQRTLGQLRSCVVRVLNLRRQCRAGPLGGSGAGFRRPRPRWRWVRSIGTTAGGSSRCSGRATRRASPGSPRTTACRYERRRSTVLSDPSTAPLRSDLPFLRRRSKPNPASGTGRPRRPGSAGRGRAGNPVADFFTGRASRPGRQQPTTAPAAPSGESRISFDRPARTPAAAPAGPLDLSAPVAPPAPPAGDLLRAARPECGGAAERRARPVRTHRRPDRATPARVPHWICPRPPAPAPTPSRCGSGRAAGCAAPGCRPGANNCSASAIPR